MLETVRSLTWASLLSGMPATGVTRRLAPQPTLFFSSGTPSGPTARLEPARRWRADPTCPRPAVPRAESLAAMLKDAKLTAIFTTEFKRTQQTAAPLAKALGLTVRHHAVKTAAAQSSKLKAAKGNALVVGHSNTVPDVIKGLGVIHAGHDRRRRVRQPVPRHDRHAAASSCCGFTTG